MANARRGFLFPNPRAAEDYSPPFVMLASVLPLFFWFMA